MDVARDQFAARRCSILIITQAKPEWLVRFVDRFQWHVSFVSDSERTAYRTFGLERTTWLTFFKPRVLWGYFRGMFKGYRVRAPYSGEDVLQLGGDFIISRDRRVRFAHASVDPVDRPAICNLLDAIPASVDAESPQK